MINRFEGVGNVGVAPVLRVVRVGDDDRTVCNLRVYFDRPVGEEYKDKGGYWLSVDIWGFRAKEAMRILKKGTRAFFMGTQRNEEWPDEKTGEVKNNMCLTADHFFIDSICVENVLYREKVKQTASGTNVNTDNPETIEG